jgi:hypothetical protein
VLGGLLYASAWLSLLGGILRLNDMPRIAALVLGDLAVATWVVLAAGDLDAATATRIHRRGCLPADTSGRRGALPRGPDQLAAASEPWQRGGSEGVFIGALILTGYLSLAFWQIALGRWTLGRRP